MLTLQHPSPQHGQLVAQVLPEQGGALAAFYSVLADTAPLHWLRPLPDGADGRNPLHCASFVLLPWSNRIAHSRFTFEGQHVQLADDPFGIGPHSLHGLGWAAAWHVEEHSAADVRLAWDYSGFSTDAAGVGWPWPFHATQSYRVDATGLQITLSLRNTGNARMPAGLGHHPYFAHDPAPSHKQQATIRAQCRGLWHTDAHNLPTRHSHDDPLIAQLGLGLAVQDHALDTHFTGFDGHAVVSWADGRALHLKTAAPLQTLVLYTPQGQPYFCVEPVSHTVNALNLAPEVDASLVGGHVLEPGECLQAHMRFVPQIAGR